MRAAIITIGDEILIGQIVDTNSAWIAEQLNLLGIEVTEIRSISDNNEIIIECLEHFDGKVDLAIFTGGLGPTRDDITKNAFNEYFGGEMKENPDVLANIERLFKLRSFRLSPVNSLQATVPDNCKILNNAEGTAPGMVFEKNNTLFVSLPGVPYEMKSIILTALGIASISTSMTQAVSLSVKVDAIRNDRGKLLLIVYDSFNDWNGTARPGPAKARAAEDGLNERPRERFGFLTSIEVFYDYKHVALQS